MKKLKLNLKTLNAEVLNRDQLKSILGGFGSDPPGQGPSGSDCYQCSSDHACIISGKGTKCINIAAFGIGCCSW